MNQFYLGLHHPHRLSDPRMRGRAAFVSRRAFIKNGKYRKTFPVLVDGAGLGVDLGGFTEVQKYGRWKASASECVDFLDRLWEETGEYDFACQRDYMCEPAVINGGWFNGQWFHGTHLTVKIHQRLTVRDFLDMRSRAPKRKIIPTLQGGTVAEYLRCKRMYETSGVDLYAEPVVGVGSVCRRQNTAEATAIIRALRGEGLTNLHGFGFKITGLRNCWNDLSTADSMAAFMRGRKSGQPCPHRAEWGKRDPTTGELTQPKNCGNCFAFAIEWSQPFYDRLNGGRVELPAA